MATKQAACLNCRKSKIKCKRTPGASVCDKCEASGTECIIPTFHVGRQKGVKNKRTGLDKAIYQIEEAIKKSRTDGSSSEGTLTQLQQLLNKARDGLGRTGSGAAAAASAAPIQSEKDSIAQTGDELLSLDDAENPLQLLARASDLRHTVPQQASAIATPSSVAFPAERGDSMDIHHFFQPIKARLDQGPDLDPIDVGLLSLEEAGMLISYFHDQLAHTRWGLDPVVHTVDFIRRQSAFLFTSLLLASARFMPSASALAKRLLLHRKFLLQQVIARRFRSVEIVLAFMVNVPWMHPLDHAADDDTGIFISLALSIALDLSLNKIITPSTSVGQDVLITVQKSDCLEAKRALAMDGFDGVDENSEWGQRLLRRRERAWLSLFVLERGVCLARGRSYCLPITALVKNCDGWHNNGFSDVHDASLISMAVLRRDLDGLLSAIRTRCDNYRVVDVGTKVAEEIETMIQGFFDRWLAKWTSALAQGVQRSLPPYVEILITHTRLSTYSSVINHPTAPLEVKRQFRASTLSSALNVMRAAVQGERSLTSMPNNTVIMICFAACVALNLSRTGGRTGHNLTPSIRNLIGETAAVLERIGAVPSHRNGASVVYGRYLRELLRQASGHEAELDPTLVRLGDRIAVDIHSSSTATLKRSIPTFDEASHSGATQYNSPFQFSTMSSNEVNETIMSAGNFDTQLFDMSAIDASAFSWMDWMDPAEFGHW
ncbi:uncharacterized protein EI97DRAFT_457893 [Westerdykella ornata]|uniref:Zn(2)-C6 fungal-type domain-containing protein n=1 Tax=Westerdykella ornata TaxID=318751 RepID=A0A6A6JLR1_WESOR|nr:uncharacterized protein EI97DRAFT_457893 [Westerdykella ornata]KAF2277184.1 hypothetical protein EI97DRAFT_457893 [Westerdykella ornata]